MPAEIDNLKQALFSHADVFAYAVLDGASIEDLLEKLYSSDADFECLYRGELEPDIAEVAPYLVHLRENEPFTEWLLPNLSQRPLGILALTPVDLRQLRTHFRRFLIVRDPNGKPLYFRYYDPRVLSMYLPTCNTDELKTVFGPVESFLLCPTPGNLAAFSLDGGRLQMNETKNGAH
jgi:hypothetical protein